MAPTTLREYLQTAEDAISSGRANDALTNCQQILTRFPEALEAQRLMGEVYLAKGQLEEAQETFDGVLTNDPENVVAYCSRALISERLSDYDTALDCYQQAYELSRGNSQIRQQFNRLSEKVGQQNFIFSRAGLARLYMRGDLLPQAIQEWETVLSATPERLDARLGLIETYWREGLYDQVEELANQLLNDIPGCLKALLLLAHVTFAQSALQAQEFMQRAKALDPDMVMAQEVFSDFMVSQPKDPFLKLLRKTPAIFSETANGSSVGTTAASMAENASSGINGTRSSATFSEPLVQWNSLDSIIEPQQDYSGMQEASSLGTWNSTGTGEPDLWRSIGGSIGEQEPVQEASKNAIQQENSLSEMEFDTWETLHQDAIAQHELGAEPWYMQQEIQENNNAAVNPEQANLEQQPWYSMNVFGVPDADSWKRVNNLDSAPPVTSWEAEGQKTELPAPPAWLDMLTKGERGQFGEGSTAQPSTTSPGEQEPPTSMMEPSSQQNAEPLYGSQMPGDEKDDQPGEELVQSVPEDEEPFFFGPEWLKSLGATAMNSALPAEAETPPSTSASVEPLQPEEPEQPVVTESEPVLAAAPPEPTAQKTLVENWLEQAAEKLAQPDQNLFTTLEQLENDLRSQGFTQLEPGALSTIAHEQEPTLSSALAQLGNFGSQPGDEDEESQLQPVNNAEQVPALPSHLDALAKYVSTPTSNPTTRNAPGPAQPVHADALSSLVSNTVPSPTFNASPALDAYPMLTMESELETTMKRPAVRLQPMQRPVAQHGSSITKGRTGERQGADGGLSYKERLLKGYQYQLAGAYDNAMQEYRAIIRNAPEFLGDVVSNMRALLKLAPKYSAGYRVLGDAYMRQGEYLQAMEAYNKALTMAKKAKG